MIEPLEPLTVINRRLKDYYGVIENGWTRWRVVWSSTQTEKQLVEYYKGIFLTRPEVMEVPKYPTQMDFYILERVVPTEGNPSLMEAWSYEPIWVFKDKNENPLPPKWEAIEYIIRRIHEQMMAAGHNAPVKPDEIDEDTVEAKEERVKRIYEALYGDETRIGDRLALGEGVGYTGNSDKAKVN
jgi:hypothetical protein